MPAKSGRAVTLTFNGNDVKDAVTAINMTYGGTLIDITGMGDAGFSTHLADRDVKSLEISVEGAEVDRALLTAWLAGTAQATVLTVDDDTAPYTVSGDASVATYTQGAPYNGKMSFTATLRFSGEFTIADVT